MAESVVNKRTQPSGGGVKPSSNATLHECVKTFFERVKTLCHPELVWQSEQTKNEFCEPASRVAGSHQPEMLNIVDFIKYLFVKRFSMTYLKKAIAFTLAETLVVMGIIGVVAALTIPNLNQSTGDREKVARVKKAYSNLEDAYGRATAVYGPIEEWFVNDNNDDVVIRKRASERFTEFMKISKTCEDGTGCFSKDYTNGLSYLLADGTSFAFGEIFGDFVSSYVSGDNSMAYIFIDIDGPKGKNELGKDIFLFTIYEDGLFPNLGNQENSSYLFDMDVSDENFYGLGATAWIIKNGNMDYLKCPEELDWETKTSCK